MDGHDHELVEEEVAGTLLVETGCHLHNVGLVVIDEGVPANEGVAYGTYDGTDASAQAVIDEVDAQVRSELGVALSSYIVVACDHEVPADYADPLGQGRIRMVVD